MNAGVQFETKGNSNSALVSFCFKPEKKIKKPLCCPGCFAASGLAQYEESVESE